MRKLLSVPAVLAALVMLALAGGCARDWPDEFPDSRSWQQRSAPLDLLDGQDPGSSYAVSAYASRRPTPPISEQQRYRDARRVPSRLDIACIDGDGDGFGHMTVSLSLSRPVLEVWHSRTWERWHLQFSSRDDNLDIKIDLTEVAADELAGNKALDTGFVPHLYNPNLVEEAMDGFRAFAGTEEAVVIVRADFPIEEAKTPLEWEFDLGPDSRAEELLSSLVEVCGGTW